MGAFHCLLALRHFSLSQKSDAWGQSRGYTRRHLRICSRNNLHGPYPPPDSSRKFTSTMCGTNNWALRGRYVGARTVIAPGYRAELIGGVRVAPTEPSPMPNAVGANRLWRTRRNHGPGVPTPQQKPLASRLGEQRPHKRRHPKHQLIRCGKAFLSTISPLTYFPLSQMAILRNALISDQSMYETYP